MQLLELNNAGLIWSVFERNSSRPGSVLLLLSGAVPASMWISLQPFDSGRSAAFHLMYTAALDHRVLLVALIIELRESVSLSPNLVSSS